MIMPEEKPSGNIPRRAAIYPTESRPLPWPTISYRMNVIQANVPELHARHGADMHGMGGMDHMAGGMGNSTGMGGMGNSTGMGGMGNSTGMGHMDGMGSMGGMGDQPMCSMNMLGNWKTIGTCFLTRSWMISTQAQFAGSCIGVAFWVILTECIRRFAREYDRLIVVNAVESITKSQQDFPEKWIENSFQSSPSMGEGQGTRSLPTHAWGMVFGLPPRALRANGIKIRPTFVQQCIRTVLYGMQFTSAYLIMLIAMTYNGYMLLSIILGAMVGYFATTWDTLGNVPTSSLSCHGSESNTLNHRAAPTATVDLAPTNESAMMMGERGF